MADNDFAIVVGITTYPQIRDLRGPERDATNFYKWLISKGSDKGNVPPQHVIKVLTSQFRVIDPDWADPAADKVERGFETLREWVKGYTDKNGQARRLYIFLAGHGLAREINSAALLAANANYDRRIGFYIEGRWYADWFRTAAYFQEIVLLMDCCRDDYPQAPERKPPWPPEKDVFAADVRTFYGFGTKWSSQAREKEIPKSSGIFQGLFTRALLDGLDSADCDAEGRLTGEALKNYIYARLPVLAGPDLKQEPRIEVDSQCDIVWAVKPSSVRTQVQIKIVPSEAVLVLVEGPDLECIGTFPANEPIHLNLRNGSYNLRWPDGREQGFDVAGSAGILALAVNLHADPSERVIYVQFQ